MVNTVITGGFFQLVQLRFNSGTGYARIYGCSGYGHRSRGIDLSDSGSGRTYLINNRIAQGSNGTDACFYLSGTTVTHTGGNFSEDATSPDVAGRNATMNWVDAPNWDLHINPGDTLLGVDASADSFLPYTTDIDGEDRSNWHAGADEYVVAGVTLYPLDQSGGTGGDNFGELQLGGSAPAVTVGPGWHVGNEAAAQYARMRFEAVEVPDTAFSATVEPSGAPSPSLGDSFVLGPISGKFLAGDWNFSFGLRAVDAGGSQDGRLRIRLWKAGNLDMSDAVEITSGAVVTTTATDIAVGASSTVTASVSLPEIVLNNQYLLLQLAWEITGQAS
jgi:hypothetical protein